VTNVGTYIIKWHCERKAIISLCNVRESSKIRLVNVIGKRNIFWSKMMAKHIVFCVLR